MPARGFWYVVQESIPTPAWVRWPEQQRFCCCCSVRTGASLIGWFNFVVNSLYIGTLALALTQIRNTLGDFPEFKEESEGSAMEDGKIIAVSDTASSVSIAASEEIMAATHYMRQTVLPMMFKSLAIPVIMIIFSVLWLLAVEAKGIAYVRLFGKAFVLAIIVQLLMQLGFLAYAEYRINSAIEGHITWFIWLLFVIYALLNIYFIPVIKEYVKRRVREDQQGLEQGLLTSEMYPKSHVAEAYIEDAFTLEGDSDIVKFQASLEKAIPTADITRDDSGDGYQPI